MAKDNIIENPVPTKADILRYVQEGSDDLAFEMEVARRVVAAGFECQTNGQYEDPIEKKLREFDIRATKRYGRLTLNLAVESKRVRPEHPILGQCVPRPEEQAYGEILSVGPMRYARKSSFESPIPISILPGDRLDRILYNKDSSFYPASSAVCKSVTQLKISNNKGSRSVEGKDSDIYGKWFQCLSSISDWISSISGNDFDDDEEELMLFLPIVVVPSGIMWRAGYDEYGSIIRSPVQTGRLPFFVGRKVYGKVIPERTSVRLNVSHLEFWTVDFLTAALRSIDRQIAPFFGKMPGQPLE